MESKPLGPHAPQGSPGLLALGGHRKKGVGPCVPLGGGAWLGFPGCPPAGSVPTLMWEPAPTGGCDCVFLALSPDEESSQKFIPFVGVSTACWAVPCGRHVAPPARGPVDLKGCRSHSTLI